MQVILQFKLYFNTGLKGVSHVHLSSATMNKSILVYFDLRNLPCSELQKNENIMSSLVQLFKIVHRYILTTQLITKY